MNIVKTILTTFLLLLGLSYGYAQESNNEFEPLTKVDTITSKKVINAIPLKDVIKNSAFFFTQQYGNKKGLFLIEKKGAIWIVYDYDKYFISNYDISKHTYYSKRYVSINVSAMRSGNGENYYGWFVLFDLEQKTYLVIQTWSHNSDNDINQEKYINTRECSSKVTFKNGSLKIVRECSPNEEENYCSNCIETGTFKIENNKLIKQ
ncbi:MAG: hypothetical protein WCJ62_10270 [Flavobacterium sp.]